MVKINFFKLLVLFLIFSSISFANEENSESGETLNSKATATSTPTKLKYFEYSLLSIDHTQWIEKMNFQFAGFTDEDKANFSGLNLNYEQGTAYGRWGWSVGASFGSGKASGGGNSAIILYQKGNQAWMSFGGFGKLYYRLSPQVSLGASLPVFIRSISWDTSVNGLTVDSGKKINSGLLLELDYRLSKAIDFYQSFGSFNFVEGSTIWKIGLGYRL